MQKSNMFKYCIANEQHHFDNSPCGRIEESRRGKHFYWSIQVGEHAVTKWHIVELNIVRYSFECIEGFVKWIVQDQTFMRCGRYLPWNQIYIGNIIINMYCVNLIEFCNFISFYELTRAYSPSIQVQITE